MKIKTKKVPPVKGALKLKADQLGREYQNADEIAKQACVVLDRKKKEVKKLAHKYGVRFDKEVLVEGKQFDVGFVEADGRSSFDPTLAETLLPPRLLKLCQSPQIDQGKLEQLVLDGKVPNALFQKMFKIGMPTERIYVKQHKNRLPIIP